MVERLLALVRRADRDVLAHAAHEVARAVIDEALQSLGVRAIARPVRRYVSVGVLEVVHDPRAALAPRRVGWEKQVL